MAAGNADAKVNHPEMKPGTYQKIEKPDTNAYNVLSNSSTNEIIVHKGGFVQLIGRDNYSMVGEALGLDFLNKPEWAAKPEVAAKIAVWYWKTRVKPYVNNFNDTSAVTKRINPALRGVDDRPENFKDYLRII